MTRQPELYSFDDGMPVREQPIREPEMQVPMNPVMQSILEQRMALAALFQSRGLPRRNPFEIPQLPPEIRPRFDVGGGRRSG